MSIPAAASGTILRSLTEYTHGRGTGYGALHPTHSGFEGMRRFSDWDAAHVALDIRDGHIDFTGRL